MALFGRPEITRVAVDLPAAKTGAPPTIVPLPFSQRRDAASDVFRVRADIWYSAFSTGRIRIAPDDCLEAITVNGTNMQQLKSVPMSKRCYPHTYSMDLSQYHHPGANVVELTIANKGGRYGINITPMYSRHAVMAMAGLLWLGIYAGALALSMLPAFRSFFSSGPGRMAIVSFLPCLGPFLLALTLANDHGERWYTDRALPTLIAAVLSFVALLACLDKQAEAPLKLRRSFLSAAISIAAFACAAALLAGTWTEGTVPAFALVGTVVAFFASVPLRPFLQRARKAPRAVVVMLIAALCPHIYFYLRVPYWVYLSGITNAMVRGILWVCGFPTTTSTQEQRGEQGQLLDYLVYVASSDLSVKIGYRCSSFEGVSLFIFLLSLFVLIDWKLFSRSRHLLNIYLVTIPFILVVNALRIAGIFLYAEWYVRQYNQEAASLAAIEVFHSNIIGWVLYSVAFAVFLPLVYRWAQRTAAIK